MSQNLYYINIKAFVVLLSAKLKLVFTPFWNSFQIVDNVFILRCIVYFKSVSRKMSKNTISSANSFSITHTRRESKIMHI